VLPRLFAKRLTIALTRRLVVVVYVLMSVPVVASNK
jgi:hypothetical protein